MQSGEAEIEEIAPCTISRKLLAAISESMWLTISLYITIQMIQTLFMYAPDLL